MKRIGAIGLFFAGTILCSCMIASAQPPMGPPDRGGDDREGPPGMMKREFAPPCHDFERAIREAYERGFRQGFEQGFKTGRHDGPKHFRYENKFRDRGPRPDGPPCEYGDFRGRGGDRPERGFGPQGPPPKFDEERGPRPDGPPRERSDFRGRGGDRPGKDGPGPRPPKPEHDDPEAPPKPLK